MPNHIKPSGVMIGQKFGKLVVMEAPSSQKMTDDCLCQCLCGSIKRVRVHNLVGGMSTSCGCSSSGWRNRKLLGRKFGKLTVCGNSFRQSKKRLWPCTCDCGASASIATNKLLSGHTKSCGCLVQEVMQQRSTHGCSRNGELTPEYRLWQNARRRAKIKNVPFSLLPSDIKIPSHCPLLGVPLILASKAQANQPSIDEVIPGKGYINGNFQIISHRANTLKNDATIEELELLISNLKLQRERLSERTSLVDDAIVQSHGNKTVSGDEPVDIFSTSI